MAILLADIKIYQCTTWTEGGSHGGDINLAAEIVDATDQNIFDEVLNSERVAGSTEYRKIFIRNENADTWLGVKNWISQFTPATNDEVSIALGTNAGVQSSEGVGASYVSPDSKSHVDVLDVGNLIEDAYQAIWIRRIVDAAGDGYSANSFILAFESS